MSEQAKDSYGIESSQPPPAPPAPPAPLPAPPPPAAAETPRVGRPIDGAPRIVPSANPDPLPLEDEVPLSMRPIKDLDVCPNCGASMGDVGEVLCMRCGFDLKTMRKVEVQTGVVEVPEGGAQGEELPYEQRKPLVVPGRGDIRLPLIMAATAGAILIIAYLFGLRGLYPDTLDSDGEVIANAPITFGEMLGLLRMIVNTAMFTACGLAALWFHTFLHSMRMGDWRLAAARMLGIVAVLQLVTIINLSQGLEWPAEALIQTAIFAGLVTLLFGVKPKDIPTLLGSTIFAYVFLWFGSWLITRLAG